MNKKFVYAMVAIGGFLFGWLVWPTPYRYDKMNMKWPVRINRFTGTTQVLGMDGWSTVGGSSSSNVITSNTSNTIPTYTLPLSTPKRAVLDCEGVKLVSGSLGSHSVTGVVVNSGDGTSMMSIVKVAVYGKDGSILATGTTVVSNIAPGSDQPFQAYVDDLSDTSAVDHVTATVS